MSLFEKLKKIFCSHEWHADGPIVETITYQYGMPVHCFRQEMVCIKCGKRVNGTIRMGGRIA